MTTSFLPAETAPPEELAQQIAAFRALPEHIVAMLDTAGDALVVLNAERQIVWANAALEALADEHEGGGVLGFRPGEVLGCVRTARGEACGTTDFCRTCGAAQAIVSSQQGSADVRECRMQLSDPGEALDLQISTRPLVLDGVRYTVFAVKDISHEKRRRVLERVFFHDVMNTAGNLRTITDLLAHAPAHRQDRFKRMLGVAVEQLIDEIGRQQELVAAEEGQLRVRPAAIDTSVVLEEVMDAYLQLSNLAHCRLRLDPASEVVEFTSDPSLVKRVLGNMLKNALEASQTGETVTLGGGPAPEGGVRFWVHNPACMPKAVRSQVFQRSFSTKEAGRGIGTYSMQLLTCKYLQGSLGFTSTPEDGTTFTATYPAALGAACCGESA